MRVVDLGWPIEQDMSVFPGDPRPQVRGTHTVERDGFAMAELTLCTHSGTHMDAPSHMIPGAKSMDRLPLETFFGMAAAADIAPDGPLITEEYIEPHIPAASRCDFLLINTGWSRKWGKPEYLRDFPVLTERAAQRLASLGLKGIGIDTISFDPIDSEDYLVHKILLAGSGGNFVLLQNLRSLDLLPDEPFPLVALPLSLTDQDGGPARIMAVLDS